MVIVDTTVWIDYLRGTENPEASWLVRELPRQPLGLTDLILCEVLQGIRDPSTLAEVRDDLLQVSCVSRRRDGISHRSGRELSDPASARPYGS